MGALDLNKMALSIYLQVLDLQNTATELVGLDVLWCRALPYENGEDVIVLEYTLSNVECPLKMRVITDKAEYQVGLYTFGPLGIDFDLDMQISINIPTWEAVYGKNTMPQKGDIVIIEMIHRIFEVSSSLVVYTLTALPTSYKCVLGKYLRMASRRESDDLMESIDEITVSLDRLFGDAISKEVADAVVEIETSYNLSTYVDPLKDFDINSIITDTVQLYKGNIISEAYYDFSIAKQDIKYHVSAFYDNESKEKHWIYSSWFKLKTLNNNAYNFKFDKLYLKEKSYWYFTFTTNMQIYEGQEVVVNRSNIITINGIIDAKVCDTGYVIKISTSEVMKANKKLTNWYASMGLWQIRANMIFNLLKGYNNELTALSLDLTLKNVLFNIGTINKNILINAKNKDINDTEWNYITFDITANSVRVVLILNHISLKTHKYIENVLLDETIICNIKNFDIDYFCIENSQKPILMTNIRLYENAYALDNTYKQDMYSQVTKNTSKLILVDTPNAANNMTFVSPIK